MTTTIYGLLTLDTWGDLHPTSNISVWRSSMFEYESDDLMFVIPVIPTVVDGFMLLPYEESETRGRTFHVSNPITQMVIGRATRRRRLITPPIDAWGGVEDLTNKVSIVRMPLYPIKLGA